MMSNVRLYTVKETAEILKSTKNYVYDLVRSGRLPAIKLGSLKIREEALYNFLCQYENWDLTNVDNIVRIEVQETAS